MRLPDLTAVRLVENQAVRSYAISEPWGDLGKLGELGIALVQATATVYGASCTAALARTGTAWLTRGL
jgi:hypothetical protein